MSHIGEVLTEIDDFKIINCGKCGFIHVFPFPDDEAINNLYKKEYYVKNKPDYINRSQEDLIWQEHWNRFRIESILSNFSKTEILGLEIGSGPGDFLSICKEKNINILGLEPSDEAVSYSKSRGLNVFQGFLDEEFVNENLNKFDFVYISHVLEHFIDAKKSLLDIKKVLKDDGILYIVVPNDFNLFQEILSNNYNFKNWWVNPYEHINYFTFSSLRNLLESMNFEIIDHSTSFPIDLFLMMGENYISDLNLGRKCHIKRKEFENKFIENGHMKKLNSIYKSLANENLGRDVIYMAKKV